MKKKFTDEEIGEIFGKVADKIRSDIDYEFRVTQSQMWLAESDLVSTFDENQQKLYKDFCDKRDAFYKLAEEIYQKRF